MVSSVRSRPNHYEVLGLSPAASQDEIAGAFAKAMGMFGTRPVALAAQLSAAFETLRNPTKRRAYDSALGLRPEPQLRPWGIAATQRGGARFADSAWGRSSNQPGPELRSAVPEVPATAAAGTGRRTPTARVHRRGAARGAEGRSAHGGFGCPAATAAGASGGNATEGVRTARAAAP